MKGLKDKFLLLFKPYLIIALSIIGGYTLFHWLFFIKLHLFSINENIIQLWIPLTLPWIPVLILLKPGIKRLKLKVTNGDLNTLYMMISGFAIIAPTLVAQAYLPKACGKLSQLQTVCEINSHEPSKYYTLRSSYIDKFHIGVYNKLETSGKHNENLNIDLFVVLPILEKVNDTTKANCTAWYGLKYHDQISNRLTDQEKKDRILSFMNECQVDFDHKDVRHYQYLEHIGKTNDSQGFSEAIKKNKQFFSASSIVLLPIDEPFESRTGDLLGWIFGAFAIGTVVWLIFIIIPKIDEGPLENLNTGIPKKESELNELFSFFLPREGFYTTPILMNLNIIVFLFMVFSGLGFISFPSKDLVSWGANFGPLTSHGEWWRLLTSTFLHGGFMHLFANMYGLLFVGIFLEPKLGKYRYAIIYLTTGIIASLASLWWHTATVSVGASGAIFGLYGVFLALLLTHVYPKDFSKAFLTSTLIFVGFNLMMGFTGGIDNAAHIGGLVSGFVIGLIISFQLKDEKELEELPENL